MTDTPPMAVWRCLSHVSQDELAKPDAEHVRMAVMYLGSSDIGGEQGGTGSFRVRIS